jgi:hypothetical protein
MESKTKKARELLIAGKTVAEVVKEVGCSKALVFGVRKVVFPEQVRKYKTRKKAKEQAKLKRIDAAKAAKTLNPSTKLINSGTLADMVNHPTHYTVGGIEVYDFIKAKGLSYELGNVVKYVARAEWKTDKLEDLRKARWYLDAAIKHEEGTA